MPINNTTAQERLDAANALAKAEALVRRSVQEKDVNYANEVDVAIFTCVTKLNIIANK